MSEKITEPFLLERGSPKAETLEQIKTLNLSRLGLKSKDLPVKLLCRLRSLESWDLAGNRLEELPRGLALPRLSSLDLSANEMEDVTTLDSLAGLEELKLEDNIYITVSDNYKLMVLLPKLKTYNGKDIGRVAEHVVAVWDSKFGLPCPRTPQVMADLEREFVRAAQCSIRFGPNSIKDYTRWRVGILAKEYLHSLLQPSKGDHESPEPTTAKENKPKDDAPAAEGGRPKRRATGDQGHATNAPRDMDGSPRKKSCVGDQLELRTREAVERVHLKPLHVLQCHSKQDSPADVSTQLWACAFQPDSADCTAGGRLAATCGGDSICLIDCETGLVMKKYKEFFTLGWSTVMMSREKSAPVLPCSILAAGGKRGLVKLIHPRANVAYGEFRASRKTLATLQFSPREGGFLFTGAYDNKVTLWDIGGIDSQYNFKARPLMVLECGSTPLHLRLPPAAPDAQLLAATDCGLYCFNIQLSACSKKRTAEMEITFPIYEQAVKKYSYRTIDGLSFLTDDIVASKSHMQPSIYLWSWAKTRRQARDKKSGGVAAVLLAELRWADTDVAYLSLSTCPEEAYVVCGDDHGKLWTYSLHNLHPASRHRRGELVSPTEVLEWPAPWPGPVEEPSINSVAMGPGLSYLVALSDKNMVVVWKREEVLS
ncbi:hypothetical protein NHX12_010704 [Muraenolepis orangiensis]|uniref:Leucine-rich repeat and WD repeat-containing protein 1 n=1 Tax=Muraenolepis orangiensis TaxID=630683 RepID=A0A9Q0DLW2_9TELE|nr:hypothetical protein NHX12_010704 [Muraenolepis orangiensis]